MSYPRLSPWGFIDILNYIIWLVQGLDHIILQEIDASEYILELLPLALRIGVALRHCFVGLALQFIAIIIYKTPSSSTNPACSICKDISYCCVDEVSVVARGHRVALKQHKV